MTSDPPEANEAPTDLPPAPSKPPESGCLYVLGGASFIPLIGVPFGFFAFFAGLFTWRKGGWKLSLIGVGGILVTALLYGGLFYFGFVQRGGIYDGLRARMAQQQLNDLVKSVEFYKVQYGSYPTRLENLNPFLEDSPTSIYDMTRIGINVAQRLYYYELDPAEETYYLFAVGADDTPFTSDDILPTISAQENSNVGYRARPIRK